MEEVKGHKKYVEKYGKRHISPSKFRKKKRKEKKKNLIHYPDLTRIYVF